MASEQLRKKWGTIFMGEREATVEQLDAMQEPLRREKLKQEQEEDYMERVRARAAERAKEILGAAYAERLRVLEEAKAEIAAQRKENQSQYAALLAEAEAQRKEAAAELARAQAEREAAVRVREAAHGEGFQTGMNQAGEELREFRAELGQSLGALLRAIAAQRTDLAATWREELAELVQEAVAAGTGHVLSEDHAKLLRTLVLRAVRLLEDRSTIVVRVNPADEAAVSDMFAAAREQAPELAQWIVNGDERMAPGGLVAESGSGSVDCRREHFREMVDSILTHLALPEREGEAAADGAIDTLVEHETARLAELAPPPEPEPEPEPAPDFATDSDTGASLDAEALQPPEQAAPPSTAGEAGLESAAAPAEAAPESDLEPDLEADGIDLANLPPDNIDLEPEMAAANPAEAPLPPVDAAAQPAEALPVEDEADVPAWLPPLGHADAETPEPEIAPDAEKANPSLAELEEELFPLDGKDSAAPEAKPDAATAEVAALRPPDERDQVLANGGFLPGA